MTSSPEVFHPARQAAEPEGEEAEPDGREQEVAPRGLAGGADPRSYDQRRGCERRRLQREREQEQVVGDKDGVGGDEEADGEADEA